MRHDSFRSGWLAWAALVLLCARDLSAQPGLPPDTLWTRTNGTGANEGAFAVCQSADQRVLVVGDQLTSGHADYDLRLALYSATGALLHAAEIGASSHHERGQAAVATADGGFLIAGYATRLADNTRDGLLIRLNAAGDTLWTRRYDRSAIDGFAAIQATTDQQYLIAGSTVVGAAADIWLVKVNLDGDTLWTTTIGTAADEAAASLYTLADGFALAGTTRPAGGTSNIYALRLDQGGQVIWSRSYGGIGNEDACGMRPLFDGSFIIAGSTESIGAGQSDYLLVRVGADGDTLWMRPFGTNAWEHAAGMQLSSDGGIVIAGTAQDVVRGGLDFYLAKFSSLGTPVWSRAMGGSLNDFCYGLDRTRDGGFIAVGWTTSFGAGALDFYTVRFTGFSGVTGTVRNELSGEPLPGVVISADLSPNLALSDDHGRYTLTLEPGVYELRLSGQCVERDTMRAVEVFLDSLTARDLAIGLPAGNVHQSSVNIVAPNHARATAPVTISNYGSGILDFSIVAVCTEPAGHWLSVSMPTGTVNPGETYELFAEVQADTSDSGVFDYLGYLDIHLNSCPDSVQRVIVDAVVVNAAEAPAAAIPATYAFTAYPNPFNPAATISFSLPRDQTVTINVFDLHGRLITRLTEGRYIAGEHRVRFDGANLPSGLYVARLEATDVVLVQKLLLLK